ncbi:MAG: sigma-70 family RNA polymerase sigma factor [Propionicimonas sp.]
MKDRTDYELLLAVRAGDRYSAAYAELWQRHHAAALRAARSITNWGDHEDLVAEAFARIFALLRDGKGPTHAFRPYLYRAIRNLAITAAQRPGADSLTLIEDIAGAEGVDELLTAGCDRAEVRTAYTGLPERWREVLWYADVEGMKPRDYAPMLGLKPTAASELARRARSGFRKSWLAAVAPNRPPVGVMAGEWGAAL